jgi:hypothetical protein
VEGRDRPLLDTDPTVALDTGDVEHQATCKPSIFWTVALFLGQLDHRFGQNDSILKQIEGANGFETFAWDE